MHLHRITAAFALSLLAAGPLGAQRTVWVVDASSGPGSQFSDIPPAIAAAASGDAIVVRAGDYSGFRVADKSLAIRGRKGARVGTQLTGTIFIPADIAVEDLGPRLSVAISALEVGGIEVRNCAGRVVLENITQIGTDSSLRIESSRNVLVNACGLRGQAVISGSRAALSGCAIVAESPPVWHPEFRPKAALVVADAAVIASRCSMVGETWTLFAPDGAPAVDLRSGRLTLTGDGTGVVAAGTAPGNPVPVVAGSGELELDSTVTLNPTGGAPAVAPSVSTTQRDTPSLHSRTGTPGERATVDLFYRPGQAYALLVSVPSAPFTIPIPRLGGSVWLDPAFALVTNSGALDPTGRATLDFVLPSSSRLSGAHMTWQGAGGDASGVRFSNPIDWILP